MNPDQFTDDPFYWFMVLEEARKASDFETAALAQRELWRLGRHVEYAPLEAIPA
jgi:hypothetical protein